MKTNETKTVWMGENGAGEEYTIESRDGEFVVVFAGDVCCRRGSLKEALQYVYEIG